MTTCRGCGALFTEGHDEKVCELVAQSMADRRDWLDRESKYIDELESVKADLNALALDYADIQVDRDKLQTELFNTRKDRDALAAHNELLISAISERFTCKESQPGGAIITDGAPWALQLLRTTPQQCLAEIRAEAVLQFAARLFVKSNKNIDVIDEAKQDADEIRAGEIQ